MVKTALPYRIIFDSAGIIAVHGKSGKAGFGGFLYNLMYINTNSVQYKKNHIITSAVSFQLFSSVLANQIDDTTFSILEPAIRPQTISESIESIKDETERIWELATLVSTEQPYQTIIFTSKDRMAAYESHKAADKKDNIIINDETEAVKKAEVYFALCREDKQIS